MLRHASLQLHSARQIAGADRGLLIVSMMLPSNLKKELELREGITVWDGRTIRELLHRFPEVNEDFRKLLDARAVARGDPDQQVSVEPRAQDLIKSLVALPAGRDAWREYEELCVEILNYAFFPQLGVPAIQNRSEDGLDIMDAVYPIAGGDIFWTRSNRPAARALSSPNSKTTKIV